MKLLFVILLTCFLFACSARKSDERVIHVEATKIESDLFMGLPVVIKTYPQDSVLWISDFRTDYLVSGVHKNSGKVLCQIARKGNGPSEMIPPVHIFFHDRELCLYDRNKFKLHQVSIDSILTDKRRLLHETGSFGSSYSLVYSLTDSTYIGTGSFEKSFSITDLSGNELYQAGELPEYWHGENRLPYRVRSLYHQIKRLCPHPSLPVFASATSDILTSYSIGNNTFEERFQILLHDYSFDFSQSGDFISTEKLPDVPFGVRDIACDSHYIYVLYDPNSREDSYKSDREIRLYDWDGVHVKTIVPDVKFSIMALDIADNAIYGISTEDSEEPAIWRIQL